MEDGGFWLKLESAESESEGLIEEEFRRPQVEFAGGKNLCHRSAWVLGPVALFHPFKLFIFNVFIVVITTVNFLLEYV